MKRGMPPPITAWKYAMRPSAAKRFWISVTYSSVARMSVPSGSQKSTRKMGVVDGGKKDCCTLPKPAIPAARAANRTTVVTARRRMHTSSSFL